MSEFDGLFGAMFGGEPDPPHSQRSREFLGAAGMTIHKRAGTLTLAMTGMAYAVRLLVMLDEGEMVPDYAHVMAAARSGMVFKMRSGPFSDDDAINDVLLAEATEIVRDAVGRIMEEA